MLKEINMFKNLRTAVIGTGSMGKNHARIYSEISDLVAIVDVDEVLGKQISEKYNVNYFRDCSEIIGKVDAVSIAVPTKYHFEIASYLIENGIHVLVEKPLTDKFSDSDKLVDKVNKHGVIMAVGHIERHNPIISYVKKNLDRGKWGDIISFSSRRVSPYPARITDVGVIFDLFIHDIDILNYLSKSSPMTVFSSGISHISESLEDNIFTLLEFENGIRAFCENSWLSPIKSRTLSILTSTHYLNIDYAEQILEVFSSDKNNIIRDKFNSPYEEPLLIELKDFLQSVQDKSVPLVNVEEASEVVKLAQKALESFSTGNIVKL